MKILLAEDNALLGKSLKRGMEEAGWTVDLVPDGDEALFCVGSSDYDAVVLDWMLPKRSGLDVLRELRAIKNSVPTIMITARGAVVDRVAGLDVGADDYLVKPFELVELIARIKALHRRAVAKGSPQLAVGALTVDLAAQNARVHGDVIDLTGKEYDLLAALAAKTGQLVRRSALVGLLYQLDGEPDSNSLDVLLARVRKKLTGSGVEIATIRGKGFVLRVAQATP